MSTKPFSLTYFDLVKCYAEFTSTSLKNRILLLTQGKWAYNYWEVEENVVELAKSLVKNVRELISEEIKDMRDSILNLDKSRVIVYDPQRGEIQLEIFLPVAVKSLREVPDTSVPKYIRAYKKFANSYIPSRNFSVYDTYYSLKPSTDITNWVPPFKGNLFVNRIYSDISPMYESNKAGTDVFV